MIQHPGFPFNNGALHRHSGVHLSPMGIKVSMLDLCKGPLGLVADESSLAASQQGGANTTGG